jgi:hypothetical protein
MTSNAAPSLLSDFTLFISKLDIGKWIGDAMEMLRQLPDLR